MPPISPPAVMTPIAILLLFCGTTLEAEWPHWRGVAQDGASKETGLISSWTPSGSGQLWRADFSGRSTPILLNGRVYAIGRTGRGITEQERVACFDAASGDLLWEDRLNVFHTTIPFNRVGWASLAGDPETGNIYAHGVQGTFNAYSGDGELLWSHSLTEEFGRISGYGGRTHTPFVDGDLVVISFLNSSWGDQQIPRHRYFAFDKSNGDVVWISTPGGRPLDTTYSTPVIAEVAGQRLMVAGNADGGIYALRLNTGESVWGFRLSRRGINVSVVASNERVYVSHSEENIDNTQMGRVVCIDATGSGDVTATHEVWRRDGCLAGYASPALADDRLYVVDNSANLLCLDADDGRLLWEHNLGKVGKGSPVWADGKIYVPTVNGLFQILQPGDSEAVVLDRDELVTQEGRPTEIYGSPAIAYGRVYLATADGLFCLGDEAIPFAAHADFDPPAGYDDPGDAGDDKHGFTPWSPVRLQVVPAEVLMVPGQSVRFGTRAFDANGRALGEPPGSTITWRLDGLSGRQEHLLDAVGDVTASSLFTALAGAGPQVGTITVQYQQPNTANDPLLATARVRVVGPSYRPSGWHEDFEGMSAAEGENTAPTHWIGAARKFFIRELDGNHVLVKPQAKRGLQRSNVYIGAPDMSGYTVQADMMATQGKRNRPDMGLIANRYTLDLMGNHQRLQVRSWASDLRMAKTIDYAWEPHVWYTVKMMVDVEEEKATIRGKVWRRDAAEPQEWTITAEDPLPNRVGSPGIYGYSAAEIFYDNIEVR